MIEVGGEGIWDISKALLVHTRYSFLSKDQKIDFNLKRLEKKYWFEQITLKFPHIAEQIKQDEELRQLLTSRRCTSKVIGNPIERRKFKEMLQKRQLMDSN